MEWSINELTKVTGVTSRTLRHYHAIGLLPPHRVAASGQRFYSETELLRLQRILLLRELGLDLASIGEVLAGERAPKTALADHLELLQHQQRRLRRLTASVRATLTRLDNGEQLMPTQMFDGFDHEQYRDEVVRRWGADAWRNSDTWWRSLTPQRRADFQREQREISTAFTAAQHAGIDPADPQVQKVVARHHAWLSGPTTVTREYFEGLADLYVTDERYSANYGGQAGAEFVRDAMRAYANHYWRSS